MGIDISHSADDGSGASPAPAPTGGPAAVRRTADSAVQRIADASVRVLFRVSGVRV